MVINCENIKTKDELHEYIAAKLNFPSYYGKNLDALYDLLTERSEETVIEIENFISLKETFGAYADAFLDTISDSCEENEKIKLIVI